MKQYLDLLQHIKDNGVKEKEMKLEDDIIKEVIDKNSAVLEFESTIDGIYINGIDLVSWNDEGKITEFKVIVRPLQAVNKLHEQMQNMLEQMKTA